MNTPVLILCFVLLIILLYYGIQWLLLPNSPTHIGSDSMDLSKQTQILATGDLINDWSTTSGGSLLFYINPVIMNRTGQTGSEYATAVNIGNTLVLNLLVAQDAGRGYALAPAQLVVQTGPTSTSASGTEIIDIPNIPLQKWTGIAIVKQGRKFNIYINGHLTVSHLCVSMPLVATGPLTIGDPKLGGLITSMSIINNPLQTNEVRSYYESAVDGNGSPYISSGISAFIPLPSLNIFAFNPFCPNGNCSSSPSIGSYAHWNSSYPS